MTVDPSIARELENFGFSQVVVVLKDQGVAAAATATARPTRAAGPSYLGYFLSDLPEAAGGAPPVATATATAARGATQRTRAPSQSPPVRVFPRLGVAVGYVDERGARALDTADEVRDVFHADPLSIIRPVRIAAARATTQLTWGLRRLGIPSLWRQGLTGAGVRVAHLDTGVDAAHPALKGRVADFAEFDFDGNPVPGAKPHDSAQHGTHTAGTICGGRVSGLAVGIAPDAQLSSGLVIEGGKALLRVLAGMEWALDQQVRVLSMSLGFPGYTPVLLAITQSVKAQGVLPVFAIGNEGPGTSRSPGNYAEALSVGATDRQDRVADFSSSIRFNRPVEPDQPNLVAPGVDVISAKPGGGVQTMDGTSMATPHVAGVAALLYQAKPAATPEQVEQAILSTCTLLPDEPPLRVGAGLINPREALRALV